MDDVIPSKAALMDRAGVDVNPQHATALRIPQRALA